ncbi:MAG: sulfatase [Planctomycetes bacterium]|nr:sulfatase [Planctomycetota bacterium]
MRILYYDIDTLRPDHLGCYGYVRDTSPNIDRVAGDGVRFDQCYVSDAPCLPSRASLFTGRFGIHSGIVNHGGSNADLRIVGQERGFRWGPTRQSWITGLRDAGYYTVSVSPFAERHSAYWFNHGFREMYNPGKGGGEIASEVVPEAVDWLKDHATDDDWFLHVNVWDPHCAYRTPLDFGNPFEDDPFDDWLSEEIIREQMQGFGSHSALDIGGFGPGPDLPRVPSQITSMDDFKRWIDGYDTGIRYADMHLGLILDELQEQGILDETAIIISSDHGENQGELNIYGDHQTADLNTTRVPLVIRWPGVPAGRADSALHYATDMSATVLDLVGSAVPENWDGQSFAEPFQEGREDGRDYLVSANCAWSCQRAVRWGDWQFLRTYHDGLKDLQAKMLFNVAEDPHLIQDLTDKRPEIVNEGMARLEQWKADMMATSESAVDPMWNVIREGGPFHTRGRLEPYCQRLRETDRGHHADVLEARHAGE